MARNDNQQPRTPYTEFLVGDCVESLRTLPDGAYESCVTDPPYGTGFMNQKWDITGVTYSVEMWSEILRVLKPGAHLLSFGGTRTFHRMACAIEDAGFEIRDMVQWIYGSGFPKNHDIGKAIDKAAGVEREVVGNTGRNPERLIKFKEQDGCKRNPTNETITAPATPEAKQWDGWGTALKPANEPICLARKPLGEKTIAANVLRHGTGGINIDGCRVESCETVGARASNRDGVSRRRLKFGMKEFEGNPTSGRYPANVIHDGSYGVTAGMSSAARYFYCAKASSRERSAGLGGFEEKACGMMEDDNYPIKTGSGNLRNTTRRNHHPTVKPLALMRYLCRLITPPNGIVLDPFAGSGTTGVAAIMEGFGFIGMEISVEYATIAMSRMEHAVKGGARNDT